MGIKVQHFEVEGASEEGVRKRRKVMPSPELESVEETISTYKEGAFESEVQIRKLGDSQKSLHLSLKPEILKLCKIFEFSDDMEGMVEEFLEYVMNNHHVSTETTILQAFKMSLCWTVASLLKQKIDHKKSVALAKQQLNFDCSKEKADFVYSLLRCIKGVFSYRTGKSKVADSPSSNEERLLSPLGLEVETKLVQDGVSKSIKEIQKKFQKKLNKLIQKQQEEKNGIVHSFEEDKVRIEERKRMEISVIRSCLENNASMRGDKLKSVEISFTKEFEELENQMQMRLKKLEAEQLAARKKIQEREAHWVDAVKSWARDELLGKRPSSEPDDYAGEVNNIAPVNVNPSSSEMQIHNGITMNVSKKDVHLEVPETIGSNDGLEKLVSGDEPLLEEQIPDRTAVSVAGRVQLGVLETKGSTDDQENLVSGRGPLLEEQIPDTSAVSVLGEVHLGAPETIGPIDGLENLVSGSRPLLEKQIPNTTALSVPVDEMQQMTPAEQNPETTTLTVPGGEDALVVPESSYDEVEISLASEESDERRVVTSNGTTVMNQQDRVDNAVNENSGFQELAQINTSSVQPTITRINGDPMFSNQAHEDECTPPSISSGMQLGAVPPCDVQNATEEVEHAVSQPVETALSIQSGPETIVSEPSAQVHLLPTSNSSSSSNAFDVPSVGEVSNLARSEDCTINPATELVTNPPLMLNQAVSQPSASSLNQSIAVPIGTLGMHFPDLRTSVASQFNNHLAQSIHSVTLVPPLLYPDLFQKESERLSKTFNQTSKDYEEKNLHRKSECENEIAQIRLKYEMMQRESETEFLTKKKEFEDNHQKVLMNIILAAALRKACLQDVYATFMQHMNQLSMQQDAQRPNQVASSPSASSPAASLQTLAPEPNQQTTAPAPIIRPRTTPTPLVQGVRPSSALCSSAIARPPLINSISYSIGNLQGSPEIRARAPHLRSSAAITSLPPHPNRMSPPLPNAPPPQSSRGLPALPNIFSTLELVRNIHRPPAPSPSLVNCFPNFGQQNTSECGTSSVPVNPAGTGGPSDIVYLSDED